MGKQLIISISREYGSGGHYIATEIAKRLDLPLYDHDLLDDMAKHRGINLSQLKKYDEGVKKPFFNRTVRGMSTSPEEELAKMQFDFLRDKANEGESFVIVGRCSESILHDYEGLVSIFVLGDMEYKIKRIMRVRDMDRAEAMAAIKRHDKSRKAYHNQYSIGKWGDSRFYDLCVNSSKLGELKTADMLEAYIRERKALMDII